MDKTYIIFDIKKYDDNEIKLWEDITLTSRILIKNNYEVWIAYEDCGLYRLSYTEADTSLGSPRIEVISADEAEILWDLRYNKEYN